MITATASRGSSARGRRVMLVNSPQEAMGAEFMLEDVPFRLEYLAVFIRPYVAEVDVVDLTTSPRSFASYLRRLKTDLVGLSINYISTHNNAVKLAAIAKRFGVGVVVGGYQATAMAKALAADPNVDCVVRGEGEETLRELVLGAPIEKVLGVSYARARLNLARLAAAAASEVAAV